MKQPLDIKNVDVSIPFVGKIGDQKKETMAAAIIKAAQKKTYGRKSGLPSL